ncbi:MAG: site-specific integrase [Bacteroidales bacterium]|nr:site-specific integrase [Bacteroidales bacterium]
MQTIISKYILRNSTVSGIAVIYLRIATLSRQKYFSTGIKVLRKNFNEKLQIVMPKDCEADFKNRMLAEKKAQVNDIIIEYQRKNQILTVNQLEIELKRGYVSAKNDFYAYCNKEIDSRCSVAETRKTYFTQITKLQGFKKELSFAEIDRRFIEKYFDYCIEVLDNKESTAYKSLSMLKTFVYWAMADELIIENPFKGFKIRKIGGNRQHLTEDELKILDNYFYSGRLTDERTEILGQFLFSCYTGLRFQDIKNLQKDNFYYEIIGGERRKFLKLIQHKTKLEVTIPVLSKADKILDTYINSSNGKYVFKVRSNQLTNNRLKSIIRAAGIDKNISFHCARHTFATLALDRGVSFDVVSKLLGHTNLKTTQIYARVTNENKFFSILKMED